MPLPLISAMWLERSLCDDTIQRYGDQIIDRKRSVLTGVIWAQASVAKSSRAMSSRAWVIWDNKDQGHFKETMVIRWSIVGDRSDELRAHLRELVIPTSMNVVIKWRSKLQRKIQSRGVSEKNQSINHTMLGRYAAREARRSQGV